MKYSFTVNAKLPSLNDYIAACNSNRYRGNRMKQEVENVIGWGIRMAFIDRRLKRTEKPIIVHFVWHEKTKRRDADNIASAKKFVLDAMQKFGVIPNDNQRYVKGFTDRFVSDNEDFVEVELEEIEE